MGITSKIPSKSEPAPAVTPRRLHLFGCGSLEAEQDEALADAARQRLQRLADDGTWCVYLPAADNHRLRPHCHALGVARHDEVADPDGRVRGVHPDLDAA